MSSSAGGDSTSGARRIPWWFLAATLVALLAAIGYSFLPEDTGPRAAYFIALQGAMAGCSLFAFFWKKGAPLSAKWIIAAALIVRAAAIPSDLIFENDVFRYLWDARVLFDGHNPYAYAPAAPELEHLRDEWVWEQIPYQQVKTIYPPLGQSAFALSRAVFGETVEGLQLLMLLFDLGTVLLLIRLGKLLDAPRAAAAYALHPLAVKEFVQGAHIDALAVLCFTGAVLLLLRRKQLGAVGLFGAAALVKVFPFVTLPVLSRRIGVFRASGVLAVFLVPTALVFATGGQPFSGLSAFAQYWIFNPSFYDLLTRLLGLFAAPEVAHTIARPVLGLTTLGICLAIAWKVKADDDRALLTAMLACVFALLLFSPAANPWYVAWLLPLSLLLRWPPTFAWTYTASLSYAYWANQEDLWPIRLAQYVVPLALLALWWRRRADPATRTAN